MDKFCLTAEREQKITRAIGTDYPVRIDTDIVLSEIQFDPIVLRFFKPITFPVYTTNHIDYFFIDYKPLDIYVRANTVEELAEELEERFCYIWVEYVEENPDKLSKSARQLAAQLRELMEEVE